MKELINMTRILQPNNVKNSVISHAACSVFNLEIIICSHFMQ
jgi:hypothetical protein